ncbi:MAG: insulinase family protein [Kofleriaceae bacterium]
MRVAVVQDARAGLVTVDVRYDVGAADDPPGRAGMAHLVEHLLFELKDQADGPTLAGELAELTLASNAYTDWDSTTYTAVAPAANLEQLIALEARRMAARCDQLDDALVERERAVVVAENAQRGDADDSVSASVIRTVYGGAHAYARPISSDEIATVTKAEVCAFIAAHYAPARATMAVTGDLAVAKTRQLIGRTFGPMTHVATAPVTIATAPTLTGQTTRLTAPVTYPAAVVAYALPPFGTADAATAGVATAMLAGILEVAEAETPWILSTDVRVIGGPRAPVLVAVVTVNDASLLPKAAAEIQARAEAMFVYGPIIHGRLTTILALGDVEAWDDAASRGPLIARYLQYADHTGFLLEDLRTLAQPWRAFDKALRPRLAQARSHRILITPGPGVDRGAVGSQLGAGATEQHVWRAPVELAAADAAEPLPQARTGIAVDRYQLDNGLIVQLAPDPDSATVDARLVFPVGTVHAEPGQPLVPQAAADWLQLDTEGYYDRATLTKIEWGERRGTIPSTDVSATATTFGVRGLAHFADWHLWNLATLIDKGRYNTSTLDAAARYARRLAARTTDDDAPDDLARALRVHLFGADHPLAKAAPRADLALASIDRAALEAWQRRYFRPRGATLIVSGRIDVAAIKREIDELFAPWADVAPAPLPRVDAPAPAPTPGWLALVQPTAVQASVTLAFPTPADPDHDPARAIVVAMLDDELRDIREGLGASYGVYADHVTSPLGGTLTVAGAVMPGQAATATQRLLAIVERLRTDPDLRRAAFVRARRKVVATAAARAAGPSRVAAALEDAAIAGGGDAGGTARALAATTLAEVTAVLDAELTPSRRTVVVQGRKATLDAVFAALGQAPEWFIVTPKRTAPPPESTGAGTTTPTPPAPPATPPPATPPPAADPNFEPLATEDIDEDGKPRTRLTHGGRAVSLDEFLRTAGRTDVIDRIRHRRWLRFGLLGAGAAAVGLGITYRLTNLQICSGAGAESAACDRDNSAAKNIGGLITAGGGALMVTAHYLSNLRPSDDELTAIANRYNLRKGAPVAAVTDLQLMPMVAAGEARLVLTGRF